MDYLRTINFLLILFLFISCKKFDQNNFKILPSVKEYTLNDDKILKLFWSNYLHEIKRNNINKKFIVLK